MGEIRDVELWKIRIPEDRSRTEASSDELQELMTSLRDQGLIQPIVVAPDGEDRYVLVAGFRRLTAARLLAWENIRSTVETDPQKLTAIELDENLIRQDLGTVEEAEWLWRVYHKLGEDFAALCATVRKSPEYVNRRFLLLQGDTAIVEAVRAGQISMAVAEELNKMDRPEDRLLHLYHATRSGCTARQARQWREEANLRAGHMLKPEVVQEIVDQEQERAKRAAALTPKYFSIAQPSELSSSEEEQHCFGCGEVHPLYRMYRKPFCAGCADNLLMKVDPKLGLLGMRRGNE